MYLAGYTNKEIAEITGLSEKSIYEQTTYLLTDLEKSKQLLANFQDSEFETPIIQEGQERGEIATQSNNPGGNYKFGVPERNTKTLTDLGITRKESSTFQQIAKIPAEIFENFIEEKKSAVNDAVAEETGYEKNTLREYKRISESVKSDIRMADLGYAHHQQVKSDTRVSDLSWTHHREVASLPPERQELFLNKAVEENLSVRELREEIRRDKRD